MRTFPCGHGGQASSAPSSRVVGDGGGRPYDGRVSLGDLISRSFWESRGLRFPREEFRRYPTMLTLEEMRMLYALASHPGLPSGDICDLGAFMGGSTVSLAAGVEASTTTRTVHSYDRFMFNQAQFQEYLSNHPRAAELRDLDLGVELYRALIRRHAACVEVHHGDFLEQAPPQSIALCFVDLDKSFELNRKVVLEFFSRLVAGAIVVQQDFFFSKTPWTAVTMHRLRDLLPFRGAAKSFSAIFEVTGDVTIDRLVAAVAEGMTLADVEQAYDYFIAASPRLYHQEMLEAARHRYRSDPTVTSTHDFGAFAGQQFFRDRFESLLR